MRSGLRLVIMSQKGVRMYLLGDGPKEGQGTLHTLYKLLLNHQKPMTKVVGRSVVPGAVFPSNSPAVNVPHDTLQAFLQPFLTATGPRAEALLAAYQTHISLLQDAALVHAQGRVGARIIRDNFSAPLRAIPRRDSVKEGSVYEANLYVSPGLHEWFIYQTLIDSKLADASHPTATLTAAYGKDGMPRHWEAQIYLFNEYDEDTVLTIRGPFPLYKQNASGARP